MGQKEYGNDGVLSTLSVADKVQSKLRNMFGLDLRSLALLRIVMAGCVIGDLMERSLDLRAHYSDLGVIPRHVAMAQWGSPYSIVIHSVNGTVYWQSFVFLVHGLLAFGMLIGYRTKLTTFLTWLLLASLQSHNVVLGHSGDTIFRLVMFFGCFLPLGACYSVDSAYFETNRENKVQAKASGDSPYLIVNVMTFGLIFQIATMYTVSVFHKTGDEWKTTYTATFYALQLDYFRTSFGDFLLQFPELLKFLTWSVRFWEFYGPFMYVSPIFTPWCRMFGVIGFVALHAGFGACLRLGLFIWVTIFAQFGLIPSVFWEIVLGRLSTRERLNFRVYFNPTSSMSEHLALVLKTFFLVPNTKVRALNDESDQNTIVDDEKGKNSDLFSGNGAAVLIQIPSSHSSSPNAAAAAATVPNLSKSNDCWLLCVDHTGKQTMDYAALLVTMGISPLLWPFAWLLRLCPEFISSLVADTLDFFHRKCKYQPPTSVSLKNGTYKAPLHQTRRCAPRSTGIAYGQIALSIFLIFVIMFIFSWNMANVGHHEFRLPYTWDWFGLVLRVDQAWNMFSPHPPKGHWWYVIKGITDDNREIEIFKNEGLFKWEPNTPFSYDKPKPFDRTFGNHRWLKFYEHGYNAADSGDVRLSYGRYICREYNARHKGADALYNFKMYFMMEQQNLDGTRSPYTVHELWDHICYNKPAPAH